VNISRTYLNFFFQKIKSIGNGFFLKNSFLFRAISFEFENSENACVTLASFKSQEGNSALVVKSPVLFLDDRLTPPAFFFTFYK